MPRSAVNILRRKRQDAVRSIEVRKRSIAALEARIEAIDAKIIAMGETPLARPMRPRLPFRSNGEMSRAIFDLLRETGGPITSAMVAERMLAAYGLPADDKVAGYAMRQRAVQALRRLARANLIAAVPMKGRFRGWERSEQVSVR